MRNRPRSTSDWTVAASGAIALAMGIAGLIDPGRQATVMGLHDTDQDEPVAQVRALLTITSIAAVNNGLLYLLGATRGWRGFPAFTVRARSLMGAGLLALVASNRAPRAFTGAALWELLGAAATAVAINRDRRHPRTRSRSGEISFR